MGLTDHELTIDDVRRAEQRIKSYISRTPVMTSRRMDAKAGCKLFFKCELFQRTGSFKFRGALNFLSKLAEKSKDGSLPCVTTHSSGNFAQALALASSLLNFKAYVVMPSIAPLCKQDAVKEYGAELILCTPTEQGRIAAKDEVVKSTGAIYAPSSQHHDIMAGQGTMFLEMFEQVDKKLDAVIVPVAGGGMISGILIAAKTLQPEIKVIAAEPELADDLYQSMKAKRHIRLDHYPDTIADGLRVSVGDVAWPIVRDLVDDVITVTEDEIKESTKLVWQCMKLCIEPSAGVGVAAVMSDKFKAAFPDIKNVGIILCGGNIDLDSMKSWL
ncbi:serine racemase-like [Acanthaster planci]|uniref:L-serine ammonia-lyase n=1 Tax=Acanthaster planci TaxID=133434 RepID=A0A8B7Z671_ACAPL|nr:serine racemase-like [Acanthaster planci]XP_022101135.1 serine racemase-like [Acanthaster planci]